MNHFGKNLRTGRSIPKRLKTTNTVKNGMRLEVGCPKFKAIVLGSAGGLSENNLTSFLLSPINENNFIALDAETLNSGIKKAAERGSFSTIEVPEDSASSIEGWILQNHIKAYLITHAHLDRIAGLIINSPADSKKIF